jgi:thymidylate synthase (FAD)
MTPITFLTHPEVRLISLTSPVSFNERITTAEDLITYCARVSSPDRDEHKDPSKLLEYCVKHKHWSIFEQASMTLEITCPLFVATQILRHRSFCFQQYSQRYSTAPNKCFLINHRKPHPTNRQLSVETGEIEFTTLWESMQKLAIDVAFQQYHQALDAGVAREVARSILPVSTATTLMMTGNVRSWIHFLEARLYEGAQKETRDVAEKVQEIFIENFPTVSKALGWYLTSKTDTDKVPESPQTTN